jgi:hypothetical protein
VRRLFCVPGPGKVPRLSCAVVRDISYHRNAGKVSSRNAVRDYYVTPGRSSMAMNAKLLPPRRRVVSWAAVLPLALSAVCALLLLCSATRPVALFQNPDERGSAALDADSWTLEGILDDGIDGDTGGLL